MSTDHSKLEEFLQDQWADPYLIHLLFRGFRSLQDRIQPALEARGHPGMGLPETRLLLAIEGEGTRINLLAERTGTSRQFTSRIVHDLVHRGYVRIVPDEEDGRASVVVLEPRGLTFFADLKVIKQDLDATLSRRIGAEPISKLVETLSEVIRTMEEAVP